MEPFPTLAVSKMLGQLTERADRYTKPAQPLITANSSANYDPTLQLFSQAVSKNAGPVDRTCGPLKPARSTEANINAYLKNTTTDTRFHNDLNDTLVNPLKDCRCDHINEHSIPNK
jgi:hypothetical protein